LPFIFDDSDLAGSGADEDGKVTAINGNNIIPGQVIDTSILVLMAEGVQKFHSHSGIFQVHLIH